MLHYMFCSVSVLQTSFRVLRPENVPTPEENCSNKQPVSYVDTGCVSRGPCFKVVKYSNKTCFLWESQPRLSPLTTVCAHRLSDWTNGLRRTCSNIHWQMISSRQTLDLSPEVRAFRRSDVLIKAVFETQETAGCFCQSFFVFRYLYPPPPLFFTRWRWIPVCLRGMWTHCSQLWLGANGLTHRPKQEVDLTE